MRVILFGFKSCGKTYYGKLLAIHMRLPFVDTDFLIEEASGKTPKDFVLTYGEEAFRSIEKECIHSLKSLSTAVISLGGGSVLDADNLKELQTLGVLVHLKKDKEILKKRVLSGELPSYINQDKPEESFESMYALRNPLYEGISAFQVETTERSDHEVVQAILQHIGFYGQ